MAAKSAVHKKTKTTKGGGAGSTQQGATPTQVAAKSGKGNHLKQAKTAAGHKKPKAAKGVKASKTTKAKTHYTAAQQQAYQRAAKAAIHRAQLAHDAKALAQRRLQAAEKVLRLVQQKRNQAIAARIHTQASRQTYLQTTYGKEARPLQIAAAHRLFKQQQIASNRQFAAKGEAIHARTTVLQTLTDAQAMAKVLQQRGLAAAARARARKKIKTKKGKVISKGNIAATRKAKTSRKRGKSPYTALGQRAGRNAAAKVKPNRQTSRKRSAPGRSHESLAHTQWITAGNDMGEENCIAVAIANCLLYELGYRVTLEQVNMLKHDTLRKALWMLAKYPRWWPIELMWYKRVDGYDEGCWYPEPGDIVGFETEQGSHCGVLMPGNMVVSWGEIVPLPAPIDEAWRLTWTITG